MLWIVTYIVNGYDTSEEFVAAYTKKPTYEQLMTLLGKYANKERVEHLLEGGGRRGDEGDWYNLFEIEEGERYWGE